MSWLLTQASCQVSVIKHVVYILQLKFSHLRRFRKYTGVLIKILIAYNISTQSQIYLVFQYFKFSLWRKRDACVS